MDKLLEEKLAKLEQRFEILPTKGRSVPLYADVNPLDVVKVEEYSPVDGRIRQLTVAWPDGCNFLVLVGFGRGNDIWVAPGIPNYYDRYNDVTISYPLDEPIGKGEALWLIIRNGDNVNNHQISATVTVVEHIKMETL